MDGSCGITDMRRKRRKTMPISASLIRESFATVARALRADAGELPDASVELRAGLDSRGLREGRQVLPPDDARRPGGLRGARAGERRRLLPGAAGGAAGVSSATASARRWSTMSSPRRASWGCRRVEMGTIAAQAELRRVVREAGVRGDGTRHFESLPFDVTFMRKELGRGRRQPEETNRSMATFGPAAASRRASRRPSGPATSRATPGRARGTRRRRSGSGCGRRSRTAGTAGWARRRVRMMRSRALLDHRVGDRHGREQRLRVGVQRVLVQLQPAGQLHQLAQVHHRHAVADVAHDGEVVGDEQVGQAELSPAGPPAG